MKRSEINRIMDQATEFCKEMNFMLPPFVYWTARDWRDKGVEYDEIRDNQLGWDITDFGSGDFYKIGLLMITLRNGNYRDRRYEKPYAEKLLIVEEGQVTPCHFHHKKWEDIINRGGGNLLLRLYNRDEKDSLADTPVLVHVDGRAYTVQPGELIKLAPGESISLINGQYHSFWGEPGNGRILVGEVSRVNDDRTDNHFLEPVGRFPEIEEDEAPRYLLAMDYFPGKAE
jgi:D-lyxose ketol-isomerase